MNKAYLATEGSIEDDARNTAQNATKTRPQLS